MLEKKIIETTLKLMRFPSVKGNYQQKKAIIEYVGSDCAKSGLAVEYFEHNQQPAVVISMNKKRKQKIFLNGHLDVVPAKEEDFIPRLEKDKIFGRGAGDMKAACAVMIETLKNFSQKKKKMPIGLMLTTDEEIGGQDGAGFLLKNYDFSSDIAIIPDGGQGLHQIITHQKGVLHLKLTATGKAAHGARPFLGENAIEKLLKAYQEIKTIFSEASKTDNWKNTLNLGKIGGGEAVNKVPDYAEMYLDIRYTKKENREEILKKIEQISENFQIIGEGLPFIQERHSLVDEFKNCMENHLQKKISFAKVEGASDGRFFSEKGIPTVITKIKEGNIHGENEWVDRKEMMIFQKGLVEFINNFCR